MAGDLTAAQTAAEDLCSLQCLVSSRPRDCCTCRRCGGLLHGAISGVRVPDSGRLLALLKTRQPPGPAEMPDLEHLLVLEGTAA